MPTKRKELPIIGSAPPPSPPCRWCGKKLLPQFWNVNEDRESTRLDDLPPPGQYDSNRPMPARGFEPAEMDPETGKFVHRSKWTETVGKRWSRFYGYDQNSLFCTLRCGYLWAINRIKKEES